MKFKVLYLLVFILLIACKKWDTETQVEKEELVSQKDTLNLSDTDEDGCLISAGYMWSQLNKECIKVYESAITLYPQTNQNNEDETLNAYIVFSKDGGNEAEVYLPNFEKSIIFIRPMEGQPWKYDDWQLIPWKGFVLKKGDTIVFSGDGEIGPKITGSDKIED